MSGGEAYNGPVDVCDASEQAEVGNGMTLSAEGIQKRKSDLKAKWRQVGSWAKIAAEIGLPKSTVHRFATTDYIPKDKRILARLMQWKREPILLWVLRGSNGTFQAQD